MTPRVVRTVEELGELVASAPDTWLESSGGEWVERASALDPECDLPATVLAPLSVTSEQVDVAAIALQDRDGIHWLGGDKWETASFDQRAHARNLVTAALAAMGIPVVDGV